jgi:hypothetical protein
MECSFGLAPDIISVPLCAPILFWVVGHSCLNNDPILKAILLKESESGKLSVVCTDTSDALPCSLKALLEHKEEFKGLLFSLECLRHSIFGLVTVSMGEIPLSMGASDW